MNPDTFGERPSLPDYETLVYHIKNAPVTWLGGLLAEVVGEAVRQHFFRDEESLVKFIKAAIAKSQEPSQ